MAFAIQHRELIAGIHVSPQSWKQHPPMPLSSPYIIIFIWNMSMYSWIIFTIHLKVHSHHNDLHTFRRKSLDMTAPTSFLLLLLIPRIFHQIYMQDFSLFLKVCAQNAFIERSPMTHILFVAFFHYVSIVSSLPTYYLHLLVRCPPSLTRVLASCKKRLPGSQQYVE